MKHLSKQELIVALERAHELLANAIPEATEAARNYSEDSHSRLAFEVGYLGSRVKGAVELLEWVKEGKKQSLSEFSRARAKEASL